MNMDGGAPSKEHINKKKEHFLIQCVCIGCEPVFFLVIKLMERKKKDVIEPGENCLYPCTELLGNEKEKKY